MPQAPQHVSADAYKPMVPKARQREALALLRSDETLARASRAIAMKTAQLRGAVMELVEQMEAESKAANWAAAFDAAHEIRGLAGTAGLASTGRIANGFCQYLDAIALLHSAPDEIVVKLHIDAIGRSARTEDDAARHGSTVAETLLALVRQKLSDVKS